MITSLSEAAEVVAGSALLLRDGEAEVMVLEGRVLGNGSYSPPGSTCVSHWATRKALLLLRQCVSGTEAILVLSSDCCIGADLCKGVESRAV